MELGIFSKTFVRPTLEASLDAVASHGLSAVQFNFAQVGLPTLPERLDPGFCAELAAAFRQRGLSLTAVSGTFNLIAGDSRPQSNRLRDPMLDRLECLAAACHALETRIITLCTGTCDHEDMWRWHPDNVRRSSWKRLLTAMKQVAEIAERHKVIMAIEPEPGNIVSSAIKARMLLDEIGSEWIKIVIDPANLFHPGDLPRMHEFLDEAFEWLGDDIVLAHAKELGLDGKAGGLAPGKGAVAWDHYLSWLIRIHYQGPLIIHGLAETQVADALDFLQSRLASH